MVYWETLVAEWNCTLTDDGRLLGDLYDFMRYVCILYTAVRALEMDTRKIDRLDPTQSMLFTYPFNFPRFRNVQSSLATPQNEAAIPMTLPQRLFLPPSAPISYLSSPNALAKLLSFQYTTKL